MSQQGGYSRVYGRPVGRLSERSGRYLRGQSSGEGDEAAIAGRAMWRVTSVFRKTQTLHDQSYGIGPALVPRNGD